MSEMMITNSLVKIKAHPPFTPELEGSVLLNPLARVTRDKAGELSFPPKLTKALTVDLSNLSVVTETLGKAGNSAGVGVDQGIESKIVSSSLLIIWIWLLRIDLFSSIAQSHIYCEKLY